MGVQIFLGLVYLAAGLPKLSEAETTVKQFEAYGFPGWFCPANGTVNLVENRRNAAG